MGQLPANGPGRGRKKGVPNKFTSKLKEATEAAFDEAGGKQYLLDLAHNEPKIFCQFLIKMIPQAQEITVEDRRDDPRALALGGVTVAEPPAEPDA
jgi:hypothetical protein